MKILVVDDEREFVSMLIEALSRKYEVAGITAGSDVIHWVQHNQVDIVLLDVILPDSNGFKLVQELKKTCPDVWVILMSGTLFDHAEFMAKGFGADGFIEKPIDLQHLQKIIEGLQDASRRSSA